jgi:hypothetical protein
MSIFVGSTVYLALAANLPVGDMIMVGDPQSGIKFDANADGVVDIIFNPDGSIESMNADERTTGQYGEYIDFNDQGDNNICFGGQQGLRDTDLCLGLEGTQPRFYSPKDNSILINENLKVWLQKGEPTSLIVQSNGNQNAKLLLNEDTNTRGEIFSKGVDNSFHINSLHSAGLYLNADFKSKVSIGNGGGNTAIGHDNPQSTLDVNGALTVRKIAQEPPNPPEGSFVIWMSNGTGAGDNGDIMIKSTNNNITTVTTLIKS